MQGTLFDIKEFAIHDGPGIRQTVFMKGCPLRCRWCHNPEGLQQAMEMMVSHGQCTHCGRCQKACPSPEKCIACGSCVPACPRRLRKVAGEKLTPNALAKRLMANADYYAGVGGGVTFSGGEPLMQADFVLKTLSLLDADVHTAVETSGYGSQAAFASFCENFDLVMLDIKAIDDAVHRHFTGVSNRQILQNAQFLAKGKTPFIIRMPMIPGVNDNEAHAKGVAEMVAGAKMLERIELLPYHVTAGAKYEMLGLSYDPGFDPDQAIQIHQALFAQYGIRSCVL